MIEQQAEELMNADEQTQIDILRNFFGQVLVTARLLGYKVRIEQVMRDKNNPAMGDTVPVVDVYKDYKAS